MSLVRARAKRESEVGRDTASKAVQRRGASVEANLCSEAGERWCGSTG